MNETDSDKLQLDDRPQNKDEGDFSENKKSEDIELTLPDIDGLNDNDFIELISNIDYTEEQYNFTDEQTEKIVTRYMELLERQAQNKIDQENPRYEDDKFKRASIYHEIGNIVFEQGLFTPHQRSFTKENIQDKIVKFTTKIALQGQHLDACYHLLEHNVLQNVHMVKPEVLFECCRDLNWYDKIDYTDEQNKGISHVKEAVFGWMAYDANFNPNKFVDFAKENTGKDKDFEFTIKNIQLIRSVFDGLSDEGYAYDSSMNSLAGIVHSVGIESNNYLIKNIAQQNAEEMSEMSKDEDYFPKQETVSRWMARQNESGPRFQGMLCIDLAPGEIGLYDRNGDIQGITDGESDNVRKLNSLPILGNKDKLKESSNAKEFSLLLSLPMRELIEHDFGIDLSKLDYSIQYYFLNFLKSRNTDQAKSLAEFTSEFGQDGFKTFLSFNSGEGISDSISEIGDKYPKEAAKQIFAKYAEIVDKTSGVRDFLSENFGQNSEQSMDSAEDVIQNLLKRGRELLIKSSRSEDIEDLLADLEEINGDIALFADTVKSLKENNIDVDLEDFVGCTIETFQGGEISSRREACQEMLAIAKKNWEGNEAQNEVLKGLADAFTNENSKFYEVKYEGKIIGFMRLDNENEVDLYAASFNVNSAVRGSGIGEAILKQIFLKETAGQTVNAEADPKSQVSSKYIDEFGFVATGLVEYGKSGKEVFEIVKNDDINGKYKYRGKPYHELVIYSGGMNDNVDGALFYHYSFPKQYNEFIANTKHLLESNDYVITAYAGSSSKQDGWERDFVVVLEPTIKEEMSRRELENAA